MASIFVIDSVIDTFGSNISTRTVGACREFMYAEQFVHGSELSAKLRYYAVGQ